jgi:hypothetical protein
MPDSFVNRGGLALLTSRLVLAELLVFATLLVFASSAALIALAAPSRAAAIIGANAAQLVVVAERTLSTLGATRCLAET